MKEYTQGKSHFNVKIVRKHSLIQVALENIKRLIQQATNDHLMQEIGIHCANRFAHSQYLKVHDKFHTEYLVQKPLNISDNYFFLRFCDVHSSLKFQHG